MKIPYHKIILPVVFITVLMGILIMVYQDKIYYWCSPQYHLNSNLLFKQKASSDILNKLYLNRTSTNPAITLTVSEIRELFPEQQKILSHLNDFQKLLLFFEQKIDKKYEDTEWRDRMYDYRLADSSSFTIQAEKETLYIYTFNDKMILVDFP